MRPRGASLPALLGGLLALGAGTLPHRSSPPPAHPALTAAAASAAASPRRPARQGLARDSTALTPREMAFLDTLEERSFRYFWDLSDPETGLTPDRAPTPSFVSVGAMGFALTAYPIGAERGYVTRAEAAERRPGLEPRERLPPVRLEGIQRGPAPPCAGAGHTPAWRRARDLGRLGPGLSLGNLPRLRASGLRAALRPPVPARLDRLS